MRIIQAVEISRDFRQLSMGLAYRINKKTGKLKRFATYPLGKGPAWVQVVELTK